VGRGAKLPNGLTQRQARFAELVAEGMEPRKAYGEAGYSIRGTAGSISRRVHDLMTHGQIQQQITEYREKVSEKVLLSLEEHLENLRRIAEDARAAGQYGAAAAAEKSRGQAMGHYVVRTREEGKLTIVISGKDAQA